MKPRISYVFIISSTLLAFCLAFVFHFSYDWLNHNLFAGLFFPVDESVFQHLKLTLYPLMLGWFIFYRLIDTPEPLKQYEIFTGILLSTAITIYTVLSIYYILQGGFLLSNTFIDIGSLFLGMLLGQFTASRVLVLHQTPGWLGCLCGILLILMAILFMYFTLCPADLPLMTAVD